MTGIDNKKKKNGKNKANALLMQTISDSNGWRQGVVAISIGTIASFPSVHINFSENLSCVLFSSLPKCLHVFLSFDSYSPFIT